MSETFILAEGENFIRCPYNVSHVIMNTRIIIHIEKCRKAYLKSCSLEGQGTTMKICRFNATHHIPAPELKFHEARCQDAFSVVQHLAYHNSAEGEAQYEKRRQQDGWQAVTNERKRSSKNTSVPGSSTGFKSNTSITGNDDENWETDAVGCAAGYDPRKKLQMQPVMYTPMGLTKSERKQLRKEVRDKVVLTSMGKKVEFPAAVYDVNTGVSQLKVGGESSFPKSGAKYTPIQPNTVHRSSSGTYVIGTDATAKKNVSKNTFDPLPPVSLQPLTLTDSDTEMENYEDVDHHPGGDSESDSDDFEGVDPYNIPGEIF